MDRRTCAPMTTTRRARKKNDKTPPPRIQCWSDFDIREKREFWHTSATFFLTPQHWNRGGGIFLILNAAACTLGHVSNEKNNKDTGASGRDLWFRCHSKCSSAEILLEKIQKQIIVDKNYFYVSKSVTLLFPSLGSGRKNKVTPWRVVKASAGLSLLKLNRTCVQKSVSGKSMCTFLHFRTLVT